jgi:hypothetical protein
LMYRRHHHTAAATTTSPIDRSAVTVWATLMCGAAWGR